MDKNASDSRNILEGQLIAAENIRYVDQPYVITTAAGDWLCMVTLGTLGENVSGTDNFTTTIISKDKGRTWSPFVRCNKHYAIPFRTPSGRIYSITPIQFSYSDDDGLTWSEPYPMSFDYGEHTAWSVSMPVVHDGVFYLAFAEIGLPHPPRQTEVFFLVSKNIMTETDPAKIDWARLPDAKQGLRGPDWDQPHNRSEEPHLVQLNNGDFYCAFRTDQGYIAYTKSVDAGRTWTEPDKIHFADTSRILKHPLACPSLWKCANGRYLLFNHNHGGRDYEDRNPAWICGGIEKDGDILWSQPEILLYSDDLSSHSGRMSYPGFFEDDGDYYIFETQKTEIRFHKIDPALLDTVWGQDVPVPEPVVQAEDTNAGAAISVPKLPAFKNFRNGQDNRAGLTLQLAFKCVPQSHDVLLVGNKAADNRGMGLYLTPQGALKLDLCDGQTRSVWESDRDLLLQGETNRAAVIIDGGPKLMMFVTNGAFNDGGAERQFGWGRFSPNLWSVNAVGELAVNKELVHCVQLFDQAVTVAQAARMTKQ